MDRGIVGQFDQSVFCSVIRDSKQPTSPIGFLFLKFPPPPRAALLVCNKGWDQFRTPYRHRWRWYARRVRNQAMVFREPPTVRNQHLGAKHPTVGCKKLLMRCFFLWWFQDAKSVSLSHDGWVEESFWEGRKHHLIISKMTIWHVMTFHA